MRAKAISIKPRTTLMVVIHEPDLGADFNQEGKRAKRVKGRASANAKPNIPMVGANQSPEVTVSTSSKPMIGAVHENDTNTKVKAIRKIEMRPVVLDAFVSTALAQRSGSLISNHPKNEKANTNNSKKSTMLNIALVESSLSLLGPKTAVISRPKVR